MSHVEVKEETDATAPLGSGSKDGGDDALLDARQLLNGKSPSKGKKGYQGV